MRGPPALIGPTLAATTRIVFCTNAPLQDAAAAGLEQARPRGFFERQRAEYEERRAVLVGDAAHTVPPTGAKGMNLAIADVVVLHEALRELFTAGSEALLDAYAETVSKRIWKAEQFSWWMTSMLHIAPDASDFDKKRQIGELYSVTDSEYAQQYIAEGYTGWPYGADWK